MLNAKCYCFVALLRHCVPRNDNPRNDKMLNAKCQMLNLSLT
jgi:hypothetical protein